MPEDHKAGFLGLDFVFAAFGVAFGAMLVTTSAVRAAVITQGVGTTTVTPTDLTGGLPAGLPTGDTLVPGASETKPFTGYNNVGGIVFQGTVTSQVYADPNEPDWNVPGLDFVYQLSNNIDGLTPDDPINRITLASFANFLTDVDYLGGTGDVAPTTADRSSAPAGKIIGFNFPVSGGIVNPGQDSTYLVVETNASTYTQGSASVIDGGTGSTGADTPVATVIFTVPEPATLGLLAMVGGMLLGRRRR
ncbi:MAG: PEP-CTERM sorting domain-containing protein [Tepidisphaeraceae bacterium]